MITERGEFLFPDHSIQATTERFRAHALTYRLKRLELRHNPRGFARQLASGDFARRGLPGL